MGVEVLYMFLSGWKEKGPYIYFPSIIMRIIFFSIGGWKLCQNKKVLPKLVFCLDTPFIAAIANLVAIFGFIKVYDSYLDYPWVYYLQYLLQPILYLLFLGYFRITIVYCKWSVKQTILMKIVLILGALSHFTVGLFFIMNGDFEALGYTEEQFNLI